MAEKKSERPGPYIMTLGPGTFFWCRCGRSADLPLCDGHHEETREDNVPVAMSGRETVTWCGCRRTLSPPDCDGTHEECWTHSQTR